MALRVRVHSPSSQLRRVSRADRRAGRDARARRPVGRRQDDDAARRRRPAASGSRAVTLGDDACCSTPSAGSTSRPSDRRVGYLFQEYALFPHLDVLGATCASAPATARRVRRPARALPDRPPRPRAGARALRRRAPARRASRARSPATRPCCCSTSRSRRSTRTREPAVRAELARAAPRARDCPTLLVTHDFEDAADARRPRRRHHARGGSSSSARRRSSSPHRPTRSSRAFTGAMLLAGDASGTPTGSPRSCSTAASRRGAPSPAAGRVERRVYPWDVVARPASSPTTRASTTSGAGHVDRPARQPRARPGRAGRRGDHERPRPSGSRSRSATSSWRLVQGDRHAPRAAAPLATRRSTCRRASTAARSSRGSGAARPRRADLVPRARRDQDRVARPDPRSLAVDLHLAATVEQHVELLARARGSGARSPGPARATPRRGSGSRAPASALRSTRIVLPSAVVNGVASSRERTSTAG